MSYKKTSQFLHFCRLSVVFALIATVSMLAGCSRLGDSDPVKSASTYTVEKGELLVTVTEDGNVESASNIDVKCKVAGGSTILWIVDDGVEVKAGDKLVELDASSLENEIATQQIAYNKAKTAVIQAEKNYEVAKIAVKEYLEGTFVKELEDAETLVTIAEENLRSAKNSLAYSERMFQRGYISELELEGQQFAVKRAQLELNSAKTARKVLVEFTKVKMLEDLRSQVETARATMLSEQAAFKVEENKLKHLQTQIENCTILAPQDGMVVYANERGGRFGQSGTAIELGAAIRDQQTILKLPDLSQMQVKVKVHETKVEDLRPGMEARIAVQGRELKGVVTSVANQPESTSWFQGNVKEYATTVKILGTPEGLKPGMTAEVEILVAHLKDVMTLPISCVVEQRGQYFCWAVNNGRPERRPIELGLSNDQFVEVRTGVQVGDKILRNPRAVVEEARLSTTGDELDANDRFGGSADEPQQESPAPSEVDGPSRPPRPTKPDSQPQPNQNGGERRSFDPMQFDKDGDGKISRDEAPERMKSFFDRIDKNSDGFLEASEMKRPGGSNGGPPAQ